MDMIVNASCFIGGIFFAAAFPGPSAYIRAKVAGVWAAARDRWTRL